MIFLSLFITFFEIGLFGFGGGYGMLSLIQHETVESHHWLSTAEFTDIVAISQMTPGPIGINSATYCGYITHPDDTYQQDVHEIYEYPTGAVGIQGTAPCRCGTARSCHIATLQQGELLDPIGESLAILHQLRSSRCHSLRHWLPENQPHPHDLLCGYRRTLIIILI